MKKNLFTLLLMTLALFTEARAEAPQIIYDQPSGQLRIYERHGKTVDNPEEGSMKTLDQSGKLSMVFAADGAVYIQGLVAKDTSNSWLKGTLSSDGTTLTVALDQFSDYTRTFDMGYQLKLLNYDADKNFYVIDENATEVTLTIDGNTLTLNGTSKDHLLGFVIRTFGNPQGSAIGQTFDYLNNEWIGYGDYNTVFTLAEEQPLQAPAGLAAETYYFTSAEYDGASYSSFNKTVNIGFDGDDVWLQGLAKYLPDAWILGRRDGNKVTFASGQFLGAYADYPIYMLAGGPNASDSEIEVKPLELQLEGEKLLTLDYIFLSTNREKIEYVNFYMGATFDTAPDAPVAAPASLQAEAYTLTARDQDGHAVKQTVQAGEAEGEFYVQGIWSELPEAWIKGRIDGNHVSFDLPQYLGDYTAEGQGKFAMYCIAFDAKTGRPQSGLTFDYDAATRKLTNASAPIGISINKTGYLSVLDLSDIELTPDALTGIEPSPYPAEEPATAAYDLQGRRLNATAKGLQLRRVRMADGTLKTVKILK